jgi:regulator of protease activity HflC (stomatin/prohibitin superfamily)
VNAMFIIFLIFTMIAVVGTVVKLRARTWTPAEIAEYRRVNHEPPLDAKRISGLTVVTAGIAAIITCFLSSLTIVPANEVGVITSFGAWDGTQSSGPGFTKPWSTVDTFGTRNQKSIRDAAETEGSANCVQVKMLGGSTGCQDLTALYTIDEANAEKLWRGWKDFSKLNVDLIERQTDDSLLAVFPFYSPLEAQGAKRGEITDKLTAELRSRLEPQGVKLESITLGTLHLPEQTQKNLNELIDADTKLQIAKKGEEQARAEAAANQARQVGLTPEALVVECLKAAREIKPQVMPSCGLGVPGQAGTLVGVGVK